MGLLQSQRGCLNALAYSGLRDAGASLAQVEPVACPLSSFWFADSKIPETGLHQYGAGWLPTGCPPASASTVAAL